MYRVFYMNGNRKVSYTVCAMPLEVAKRYMRVFCDKYINPDGTGKPYPNGRGHYGFGKPWIERVGR